MKLRKVRVQNYKSIVDSGEVDVEERVTVLIGKNEQGKTTFLKALVSANPEVTYQQADFPTHLRPELSEKNSKKIPIVTLWLAPDSADVDQLKEIVPGIESISCFKIAKFYDGHRESFVVANDQSEQSLTFKRPNIDAEIARFRQAAESLRERLKAHASRLETFAPHLPAAMGHIDQFMSANFSEVEKLDNLIKTFSTSLGGLPGIDAAVQEDLGKTAKEIEGVNIAIKKLMQNDPARVFDQLIPVFVLHSTLVDKIPNEVNIVEFIKNPEAVSRGMANLCRVAGLSTQKIQELANSGDREAYEDHYRAAVSGGINEFWTQEQYQVYFRLDRDKMSVTISDVTYERRIPPLDRSDGFQWYLSFYAAVLNDVSQTRPTIFLLDNPGLEFHADGQRDIRRFLEERLPEKNAQVIYVTHSSAMIDPFNLEQVRQVGLQGDMLGTKVGRLTFKEGKDFDLLEPVRSAIGASLASSLVLNEFNILVEGAADKPILEGALAASGHAAKRKILVNGSVAESGEGFLVRFYQRANLPFIVYLDADSAGRRLAENLMRWGVPESKILPLSSLVDLEAGRDMELEDLISIPFYHSTVQEVYPGTEVESPSGDSRIKRTKYYEEQFKEMAGFRFNKRRVAEQLKKRLSEGKADEDTKKALFPVIEAIVAALEQQASPHEPADGEAKKPETSESNPFERFAATRRRPKPSGSVRGPGSGPDAT